jgi:NADH:ubiquinone oxidoreductase subunit F (NADH-binding)/(2Fe-2S) ferredoxin
MRLMDNCCDQCTHSAATPCPDYLRCRTTGPLCHESDACKEHIADAITRVTYGDGDLRITVGMSTCGLAAGAQAVYDAVHALIQARGLPAKLVPVGCMGCCYAEVLLEIQRQGSPAAIYDHVDAQRVPHIVDAYLRGDVSGAFALRSKTGQLTGEAEVPLLSELEFFQGQVRDAIENCGVIDPTSIEEYLIHGGYQALTHVFQDLTPDEVIAEVAAAKLRGRGGAGFPTGLKWQLCRQAPADHKYVICNADEGDPGAFMNRLTAEGDPHKVLEGLIIAAYAIGASKGYIFVRAEKPLMAQRFQAAVAAARRYGLLGDAVLASAFHLDVDVVLSAGAFVCGEETGMMAAIEGKRAMPRPRPPFPATQGLWNRPTTINNVETLAHVPRILAHGAAAFTRVGTPRSAGTKVYCLTGKIARTGAVEVPLGTTLRRVLFELGGGILAGKAFKAVQTGGPSGGCLPAPFLDLPLDYETLQAAGSIMGSGGIVVLDETTCIVDLARYFLTFTTAESCGKCTPCRDGLEQMLALLTRITEGQGRAGDLEQLQRLSETICDASLCALGRTAPNPVLTTLTHFRAEYEAHIHEKRCPAHVCAALVQGYHVVAARCVACGRCLTACPVAAIAFRERRALPDDTGVRTAVIDAETCIKCGNCARICPVAAIEREW